MHIDFFQIPFVIILGVLFAQNETRNSRLYYIVLCSIVFIFVAAMRDPMYMTFTYGIDSQNYKDHYEQLFDMSWNEVWAAAYMRYFGAGGDADIGYYVLAKFIGYFTHEFAFFSLFADLLFFVPFGILLYRYSTNISGIIFAFVYYVALIQIYLIGGGRQMFAIGLDLMALISVIDRKKFRAIFFFLLGVTIHFSSFLFLAPLLMVWFDAKPKTLKLMHVICFIIFPIVLLMPNQVIAFMGSATGSEKYAQYGKSAIHGGANVFIVLMEILSFFCLVAIKKKHMLLNKTLSIFYVMLPFLTFFTPLIRSNGTMIRITLYYSIFLPLLVPFGIDCIFNKGNKMMANAFAIGSLAVLALASGGLKYYFYWQ